jgi:hypothetical protein
MKGRMRVRLIAFCDGYQDRKNERMKTRQSVARCCPHPLRGEKMAKNHQEKVKTIKQMPEADIVSAAVLRVVGTDLDDSYEDVDEHPGSLDLPVQRRRQKPRDIRHL